MAVLPAPNVPFINPLTGLQDVQWSNYLLSLESIVITAAPVDARYLVATPNGGLSNESNLGALATGFLFLTVAAGIAVPSSTLNGSLLTALNASNLASGVVPHARKWTQATTTLTGTQHDLAVSADSLLCNNSGGALVITGIASGVAGQRLNLWAIAANTVTLNHLDAGSAVPNQIITPTGAAVVLTASVGRALLEYDGTSARWRVFLSA